MTSGAALRGIYSRLRDSVSRTIFTERMLFLLDKDWTHIRNIVAAACRAELARERKENAQPPAGNILDPTDFPFSRDTTVVVFGAGFLGQQIVPILMSHGCTNVRLCDNNPALHGKIVASVPVISPEKLRAMKDAPVIVAVKDGARAREIAAGLAESLHGEVNRINLGRIYHLPRIWRDEYFSPTLFPPGEREVYVDAGLYDGGTIRRFAEYAGGRYDAIYGFEPDPEGCRRAADEIESAGLANVRLLQKGLWSTSTTLRFQGGERGSAAISEIGEASIQTVALDEMGLAPTFIKMDIEGAELAALRGAERTIREHRPRLAICVYHRDEDILDIPSYLQSIVPEYEFYLRHHSFSEFDTVLYAAVRHD